MYRLLVFKQTAYSALKLILANLSIKFLIKHIFLTILLRVPEFAAFVFVAFSKTEILRRHYKKDKCIKGYPGVKLIL